MRIRFQADADLNPEIARGLLRKDPSVDFQQAAGRFPDGTPDPQVLRLAAEDGRVLVSRDLRTMEAHFLEFIALHESPGLLLIPSNRSIGAAIESLLFVWQNWTPDDLRNRVKWLPRQ